jgi:hypothetical protein
MYSNNQGITKPELCCDSWRLRRVTRVVTAGVSGAYICFLARLSTGVSPDRIDGLENGQAIAKISIGNKKGTRRGRAVS